MLFERIRLFLSNPTFRRPNVRFFFFYRYMRLMSEIFHQIVKYRLFLFLLFVFFLTSITLLQLCFTASLYINNRRLSV